MYINTSFKYHRVTCTQACVITKVHDLLGQPSYMLKKWQSSSLTGYKWGRCTLNVLNFLTFFSFCSHILLVIMAGIHRMLVRITNMVDPDQTSSEAI